MDLNAQGDNRRHKGGAGNRTQRDAGRKCKARQDTMNHGSKTGNTKWIQVAGMNTRKLNSRNSEIKCKLKQVNYEKTKYQEIETLARHKTFNTKDWWPWHWQHFIRLDWLTECHLLSVTMDMSSEIGIGSPLLKLCFLLGFCPSFWTSVSSFIVFGLYNSGSILIKPHRDFWWPSELNDDGGWNTCEMTT